MRVSLFFDEKDQLEKFKKLKEEISDKAKEKIKELTAIGKNKIMTVKKQLKEAKNRLVEFSIPC